MVQFLKRCFKELASPRNHGLGMTPKMVHKHCQRHGVSNAPRVFKAAPLFFRPRTPKAQKTKTFQIQKALCRLPALAAQEGTPLAEQHPPKSDPALLEAFTMRLELRTTPRRSLRSLGSPGFRKDNLGTLLISIGFWGILHYSYNKEPPK